MGLTLADLKQIVIAGFKSAFLPFHVKQQYLRTVSEELRAFTEESVFATQAIGATGSTETAQA
jgi:adenosine deaminase